MEMQSIPRKTKLYNSLAKDFQPKQAAMRICQYIEDLEARHNAENASCKERIAQLEEIFVRMFEEAQAKNEAEEKAQEEPAPIEVPETKEEPTTKTTKTKAKKAETPKEPVE